MKNALYVSSILLGLCLFIWAFLSPFVLSSMQNDAAMNQIKPGENAALERTFINIPVDRIKDWSFLFGAGFILVPVYLLTKRNQS